MKILTWTYLNPDITLNRKVAFYKVKPFYLGCPTIQYTNIYNKPFKFQLYLVSSNNVNTEAKRSFAPLEIQSVTFLI